MNWKTKAFIQNIISLLPSDFSYEFYYRLQRRFGSLKKFNPEGRLNSGIGIAKQLRSLGMNIQDRSVFELGTGRAPLAPLAFWLMGASKITTVDLNPYVKSELIEDSIKYIIENRERIEKLFGEYLVTERLEKLISLSGNQFDLLDFFKLCSIEYKAPCDASETLLPENSIDFFVSCAVMEHIPAGKLRMIIDEGNRILKDNGVFINYIDYHDHFATGDKNISAINFLKYSEKKWHKYAGNRYMYMNRLRHDDYIGLFEKAGHKILAVNTTIDKRSEELLKSGSFTLDKRFIDKDINVLAITGAMIATGKC